MNKIAALAVTALLSAGALTVPAAATAAPDAATVPQCGNGDLHASYHATDAGAGHRYGVLRLTNTSGRACVTGGFGGLSYVGGGDGTQVGAPADRTPSRVRTVTLLPGQSLRSSVDEVVAQNFPRRTCRPEHVDGFRVYAPDQTASQFVVHPTTGCAADDVHLISHTAYATA